MTFFYLVVQQMIDWLLPIIKLSESVYKRFFNPFYPPILGDFGFGGHPQTPGKGGFAPLHTLFNKRPRKRRWKAFGELVIIQRTEL
jgi:hypothetical protein